MILYPGLGDAVHRYCLLCVLSIFFISLDSPQVQAAGVPGAESGKWLGSAADIGKALKQKRQGCNGPCINGDPEQSDNPEQSDSPELADSPEPADSPEQSDNPEPTAKPEPANDPIAASPQKYGIVYSRAYRTRSSIEGYKPAIEDQSAWDILTDVKNIDGRLLESDVVYDGLNGDIRVLYNCTDNDQANCAAFEARVNPAGTEILFSVLSGKSIEERQPPHARNPLLKYPVESRIYHYVIGTGTLTAWPHTPGTHDRMPEWINNHEVVFVSDRAKKYPVRTIGVLHRGKNQSGGKYAGAASPEYGRTRSLQLWKAGKDGSNSVLLTPHDDMALRPTVTTDGDIYYSCWASGEMLQYTGSKWLMQWPGTVANEYWLCRVNQDGGDATVVLGAHNHGVYNNPLGGGTNIRALRAVGEDSAGNLYVTNYYRGRHMGLGIIYSMTKDDPHVEGELPVFNPSSLSMFTPYGQDGDNATRRQRLTEKPLGKAGYMNALPDGEIMVTHGRGWCYDGLQPTQANANFLKGEPACDIGIYQALANPVMNPFTQLAPLIDSSVYHEFDADSVAPYQELYGQPMPLLQELEYDATGHCYLNVVDVRKHELFPVGPYKFAETDKERCLHQGCLIESLDFSQTIDKLGIWTAKLSTSYNKRNEFLGKHGRPTTFYGAADIEADGSLRMQLPCNTPFLMAGLDSDGMMIAKDQILHSLRPGENRFCHGCHDGHSEGKYTRSAAERFAGTMADGAQSTTSIVKETLKYTADIKPILDSRCSGCHQSDFLNWDTLVWDYRQTEVQGQRAIGRQSDVPSGVTHIHIDEQGEGYRAGDTIEIRGGGGSGATAEVAAVGPGGQITRIKLVASGDKYNTSPKATVISSSGVGAILTPARREHWLDRPYTSKWVHKFSRESLLYWKCMGSRQDGRTDSQYPNDIDFGPAHVSGATEAECHKLGRWIDGGAGEE